MDTRNQKTLQRFYEFCRKHNIPEAILLGIPYIGSSLNEIIYGGQLEDLFQTVSIENEKRQIEIIRRLEVVMERLGLNSNRGSIAVIGGGNAEYLYRLESEISLGQKNLVSEAEELVGGGGMNFAARLLATSHEAFPVLNIGNDRSGIAIQRELIDLARKAQVPQAVLQFIDSDDFFVSGLKTAFATIIVQGTKRTILTYSAKGEEHSIREHFEARLENLRDLLGGPADTIRISHLHAQNSAAKSIVGNEIIKEIIGSYANKSLIVFNPGFTQINQGIRYWEKDLQRVSLFQVNLTEAKRLFSLDSLSTSLEEMIEWFKCREISAVITLAKFGAIGTYKSGRDGIVFAWPIEIDDSRFIDPTGAGDAFSAGIVSKIHDRCDYSFHDFHEAVGVGRLWSTYACTKLGGASCCPNNEVLDQFWDDIESQTSNPTEVVSKPHAEQYLRLINKAFEE